LLLLSTQLVLFEYISCCPASYSGRGWPFPVLCFFWFRLSHLSFSSPRSAAAWKAAHLCRQSRFFFRNVHRFIPLNTVCHCRASPPPPPSQALFLDTYVSEYYVSPLPDGPPHPACAFMIRDIVGCCTIIVVFPYLFLPLPAAPPKTSDLATLSWT